MSHESATRPTEVDLPRGTRVVPEAPTFDPAALSARAASGQLGPSTEIVGALELSPRRSLLVLRHPVSEDAALFGDGEYDAADRARIRSATQGLSLVTVKRSRESGEWRLAEPAKAPYNRRIHGATALKITGPAAGDERLRTTDDPAGRRLAGVRDVTAGALTPWGTVLAGQGLPEAANGDARRGWVVEVDPLRPTSRPRARTMLGRLDHTHLSVDVGGSGQVLVTLTRAGSGPQAPTRRFRFVSRHRYDDSPGPLAASYNRTLLKQGTLWVLGGDGVWVPLTSDRHSHVPGLSVADVLLDLEGAARLALAAPEPAEPARVR